MKYALKHCHFKCTYPISECYKTVTTNKQSSFNVFKIYLG